MTEAGEAADTEEEAEEAEESAEEAEEEKGNGGFFKKKEKKDKKDATDRRTDTTRSDARWPSSRTSANVLRKKRSQMYEDGSKEHLRKDPSGR